MADEEPALIMESFLQYASTPRPATKNRCITVRDFQKFLRDADLMDGTTIRPDTVAPFFENHSGEDGLMDPSQANSVIPQVISIISLNLVSCVAV